MKKIMFLVMLLSSVCFGFFPSVAGKSNIRSSSNVRPVLPKILSWTGDDTNWIATYAGAGTTISGDTTYKIASLVASAKLTNVDCAADHILDITRKTFTPVDIIDTTGVLHVRVFHSFPDTIVSAWRGNFVLGSGTGTYWYNTNTLLAHVYIGDGQDGTDVRMSLGTGFDEISIPLNGMINTSFNATDVSKFMFSISANYHADLVADNYICIDEIWVTAKIPTPAVIIMTDDAAISLATEVDGVTPLEAAASRGIRVVIPVIPESIDTDGYMTTAQLIDAVGMGHQLIVHSSVQMSKLSYAEQFAHMSGQKLKLKNWETLNSVSNGTGFEHYLYHGNLSDSTSAIVAKQLYKTAWTCLENTSAYTNGGCLPADPHRLIRSSAGGYTITAGKAALDRAISLGNYICLYWHNISADGTGANNLDKFSNWVDFLDYINTQGYANWTCDNISNICY